ncbi:MAG TPA: sugar kinase [Acidobacteriaceae bacterium]|jgi:sugar/nucleoside kinase (ribokinase family)|nr:sugar kinase [Acidobacteriaceae bacterium]
MPQFDITLAGEANLDMIFYGLPLELPVEQELLASGLCIMLGGSSANTAHNLARLGSSVGFISQAGDDAFHALCLRELQDAGVDVSRVVPPQANVGTGITVFLQHEAVRRAFTYPGSISKLRFSDLDLEYLASSRHFHLAALFLQDSLRPDAPKLLAAMQKAGLSTSLDTNDDPSDEWNEKILETLKYVDIFLPNEKEVCRIAREDDVERAAQKLAAKIPTVVVKRGDLGAFAVHHGKRYDAAPISISPVDAVGAGDSFNAGFLHAWTHGAELEQCLQTGNLCGAFSTTAQGGTRAFLDAEKREEFFAAHGKKSVMQIG